MLFVADLIATYCGCCYTTCVYFIMSLNYVLEDVIAMMWKMLNHIFFLFCFVLFFFVYILADVVAMVADGVATQGE